MVILTAERVKEVETFVNILYMCDGWKYDHEQESTALHEDVYGGIIFYKETKNPLFFLELEIDVWLEKEHCLKRWVFML